MRTVYAPRMYGAVMLHLLEVAVAAIPDTDRQFLAGGPSFAKNCHSLVVSPDTPQVISLTGRSQATQLPGGECSQIPSPVYRVTYVRDCYPQVKPDGGTIERADPAELTAWTVDYMDRVTRLVRALIDADADTAFGGDCAGYTVQTGQFSGPLGRCCWVGVPVQILDTRVPD